MIKKRVHFRSRYHERRPNCVTTFGWKMDRVEWYLSDDIEQITCRLCLRMRNKLARVIERDLLAKARQDLLSRELGPATIVKTDLLPHNESNTGGSNEFITGSNDFSDEVGGS